MILLNRRVEQSLPAGCFADHQDAGLVYHLPDTLATVERGDGTPDFNLIRYGGDNSTTSGGFLSGGFELRRDDIDRLGLALPRARWEPVDVESASVRLLVRSRTEDTLLQKGEWHSVALSANRRFRIAASLAKLDASLLAHLISGGENSVELELSLQFRGLLSGFPGYVVAEQERLTEHLRALVGGRDIRRDEFVAAFLSLPDDGLIVFHPLDRAEPTATARDELLEELAVRALERLCESVDPGDASTRAHFRLREFEAGTPAQLVVALHTPRMEDMEHRLSWSVSELYLALTDAASRAAHFSFVGEVSPFSEVRVPIANSLPFDPAFLRRVVVDVRYTGRSGVLEHQTFRFPDDGELQEIRTHFPSVNSGFALESRVRSLLSPPGGAGWPVAWPREAEFVKEESGWIEITPERARVRACTVSIDARAFERASRVFCAIRPHSPEGAAAAVASVELVSGRESAAMVAPEPPEGGDLELVCVAFPPVGKAGGELTLASVYPCPRHLTIPIHRLEVLEPEVIEATLARGSLERVVFASVEFKRAADPEDADGALRTFPLEEARPSVTWKAWREGVFDTVRYFFRTHFVVSDASGRNLPMLTSSWIEAAEHELNLEAPLPAEADEIEIPGQP